MPTQTRKQKPASERKQEVASTSEVTERTDEQQELLDYSDELIEDIEDALQGLDWDLATEFIQAGGE